MQRKYLKSTLIPKVCHHNHTPENCVDATDTEVVTPGEVVAPEDHDTRRKDVVALETGDGVAPEVHNTRRDDVAMLEEGEDVAPEDRDTRHLNGVVPEDHDAKHDGVIVLGAGEDEAPEVHAIRHPSGVLPETGTLASSEASVSSLVAHKRRSLDISSEEALSP